MTDGSAFASDPPDSPSAAESNGRPGDVLPPVGNTDVQTLRERVPSSLFPDITETLQLSGSYEVYRAVADVSTESTYHLENPLHSLDAKLSPGGVSISSTETVDWTWNLKFDGYGRATSLDHVANPTLTVDGSRVEYHYSNGVTEWYVNGPLGLQQGFTFESKPASSVDGPLEVQVAISGDVTVDVNETGTSALLHSADSLVFYSYGGLYAYDASGGELGARLQATSSGLSIIVDDAGAQYPITIDPFIEKNYFAGSADDKREGFGTSVSMSGDTVVVGVPGHWWSEVLGAVYLFTLPDSERTALPDPVVLKSPRAVAGDGFGRSVAINGDAIVVGAPNERDEELDPWFNFGAVYVFAKPSGGWMSTSDAARLTPPDVLSETGFGTSVAISGDTIVVGTESSSAYVFNKPGDGWTDTSEASKLTSADGSDNDRFGYSVAVSGDRVVVGAYLADLEDDQEDFGAAYVFTKPSGGWENTSDSMKLTAPDGAQGREFGWSLSLTSDTLVVGAPYSGYNSSYEIYREAWEAEDKTPYLGSVYVYSTTETDWTDSPSPVKITAHSGVLWTRFGWSVSVSGDTLAIGEPYRRQDVEDGGYSYRVGAAYVFTKPSGGWDSTAEHRELPKPDFKPNDDYGSSVYVSGEVVIAGAPEDDNENGSNAGSVYLFRTPADGWTSDAPLSDPVTLKAHDGPAGDRFGQSVAVDGEALVIGVPGDHEAVSGEAYLFVRRNNEWDYRRIVLDVPDANPGGRLGSSVSVSGDTIVVGAPGTENGNDPGAAYVFMRPEDGWDGQYMITRVAKLTIPDATSDARFGHSVATDGDTIVVGSPGEGAAYVYTRPDTGWSDALSPAKLISPRAAPNSRFGHAVSLSGDTIVVGDPGVGTGVAYVYTKPDTGWADTSAAARLAASDAVSGDRFGYAVSTSGSTVLVGAPGNENGEGNGAAYVFTKPDAGWSNTSTAAKLTASDGAAGDWFGHSVSVSDQFIAVGAHGADNVVEAQELEDSGAVYAFRLPQDGQVSSSSAQKLTAKDSAPGDTFGYSVAVSGDTLAVGMPNAIAQGYYGLRGAHSGAARVFTWPGLFWVDTPAAFKIVPPNAESSRIFGVTLSEDGNTAVVGTTQVETSSAGAAKAFVYTRRDGEWDTSTPTTLTLPEGGTYSSQGLAVSENGDTVAVTHFVPATETSEESGTVLVFTRPGGGWASTSQAARLTMPSDESEGSFGSAVSISGDTIVVGAHGDDSYYYDTDYKGAAFVFTKPNGGWVSTSAAAKLTTLAGDPGDEFGRAVAVSGDTIVIAAPGDRNHMWSTVGSVYVFTRPSNGWASTSESVKLVAPDAWSASWYSGNDFGASVALKGDTVVVGARGYYSGGAYVFTRPSDGWDNPYIVSKLTLPSSEQTGNLGASVSMSDDAIYVGASDSPGRVYVFPIPTGNDVFTGFPVRLSDPHGGIHDAFGGVVSAGPNGVAVGALLSDDHGEDRGAAYIFTEPSDGWDFSAGPKGHTAKLIPPEWYPGNRFGKSVSPSGEAVGVGAPNSGRDNYPGAAYVFTGPFNSLFSRDDAAKLSPPDETAAKGFGWSVSLNSNAMAVGAPGFDGSDGEAYVFTKPDEGWESTSDAVKVSSPGGQSDRYFGDSVSLSENTLAVGAARDYYSAPAGSVHLFTKPDGTAWNSAADLTEIELPPPDSENASRFGRSVAITDDTLVVGMPRWDGVGAVYVYTRPSSGWASVSVPVKLTPPEEISGEMFGESVAISGDTVVVGAPGTVHRGIAGAVYVFTKPAGGWVSTSDAAKLTPESSHENDTFGTSVAVEGDTVIVGGRNRISYYWRDEAYVFTKPQTGWVSASAPPINVFACHSSYDYYGQIGTSVGVSGDTVFVGAPNREGVGAVCVYEDFLDE